MMNDHSSNNTESFMLLPPSVEMQDLHQEAELLKLEGKTTVSISILYKKALNQDRVYYFDDLPSFVEYEDPWVDSFPSASPAIVEMIVDWALDQITPVQSLIWEFLQSPEELYQETLRALRVDFGIITEVIPPDKDVKHTKIPISKLIREAMPASLPDLIQYIQSIDPARRRPAMNIRQVIRRGKKNGSIIEENGVYYYRKGSE